jgi:monoamine oxidase
MKKTDVIVIGAGAAGITAAHTIGKDLDTIVLEARDRIGGRVHSSRAWSKETVDLGASWLTHALINPLADIVKKHKIKLRDSNLLNFSLRTADGDKLSEDDIAKLLLLFLDIYAEVKENAEEYEGNGEPDRPAKAEFDSVLASRNLSREDELGVRFFFNFSVAEPYASDLDKLSLFHWDDDSILAQAAMAVFPNGYIEIFEKFAKKLDIRLGHVVTEITRDKNGVTVKTANGKTFRASYAIVSIPHGVLKGGLHDGSLKFSPDLPARKRAAIGRLETGLSDKFYFRFPKCFWGKKKDLVNRIDPDGDGAWSTWVNFHKYTGKPVLMCFNRTEHAKRLESMSDDEVIDEAMKVIEREYGPQPRPKLQRSHWGSDPFSRGTLTYVPPNATANDFVTLSLPVGRVYFAGDSTISEYHGTVMAAYLSGVREGLRVLYNSGRALLKEA